MFNLMTSTLLSTMTASDASNPYFSALGLLTLLGFIAATVIGSIAWYNSKRPIGWKGKERPDIIPDLKKE